MKILIVDDSELVRAIIKPVVLSFGYDPLEAACGLDALLLANTHGKEIACITLDWQMPGLDGFEFLETLKKGDFTKDIPVLMVTSITDSAKVQSVIEAGAAGYQPKPFQPEEIKVAIERVLE